MRNRSVALTIRLALCLALAPPLSCALAASNVPSSEPASEYNQGVDAYRAKDYAAARLHWNLATHAPDVPPEVYNNLGFLLHEGLGGDADLAGGVALWRRAAEQAVSESQMHLGYAYEDGTGVDTDPVQAYAWALCALATSLSATDQDDAEVAIRKQIYRLLEDLAIALSPGQRAVGAHLGEGYVARYSKRQAE